MVRLTTRVQRDERGATMVFFTIVLVVMLGMSAMVVDLGHGRAKRRQVQNSADAAALAAAQELPVSANAVAEAQSLAEENLEGGSFTWSTCTDATPLPQSSGVACISFDNSFSTVHVRIPRQTYTTLFGGILGTKQLHADAVADARIVPVGLGRILPFGVLSTASSGELCLKDSTAPLAVPPCNGPDTGNFGMLDFDQYGNAAMSTTESCTGDVRRRFSRNVAMGIDHMLSVYSGTSVPEDCFNAGPNDIPTLTGNSPGALDDGLVGDASLFGDGEPGRLMRGSDPRETVEGHQIDDKPLWDYIPDSPLPNVPASCQHSAFTGLLTGTPAEQEAALEAQLTACFTDYNSGGYTGIVFSRNTTTESPVDLYDIQTNPRFGHIPEFFGNAFPNGASATMQVKRFRAVFLHRVLIDCNANSCGIDHAPGPWDDSPDDVAGNKKIDALTGFLFNPTMLPGTLGTEPGAVGESVTIELVR
jgi:putative Flp pilus-assembly TadE/G-like protein